MAAAVVVVLDNGCQRLVAVPFCGGSEAVMSRMGTWDRCGGDGGRFWDDDANADG